MTFEKNQDVFKIIPYMPSPKQPFHSHTKIHAYMKKLLYVHTSILGNVPNPWQCLVATLLNNFQITHLKNHHYVNILDIYAHKDSCYPYSFTIEQ